jgi:hypothetical protein
MNTALAVPTGLCRSGYPAQDAGFYADEMRGVPTILRRVHCTTCGRKATIVVEARPLPASDDLHVWPCPDSSCEQANHILSGQITNVWPGHGPDPAV